MGVKSKTLGLKDVCVVIIYVYMSLLHYVSSNVQNGGLQMPQNTAAYSGTDVTLVCSVDSVQTPITVQWTEYVTIPGQETLLSTDGVITPTHPWELTVQIQGTYNLFIPNIDGSGAGKYGCSVSNATFTEYRLVELLVITSASCHSITVEPWVEDELIQLYCETYYQGLWYPSLTWTDPENQPMPPVTVIEELTKVDITSNRVALRSDHNAIFRCTFEFPPPKNILPSNAIDDSAPTFSEYCDYAPTVLYRPLVTEITLIDYKNDDGDDVGVINPGDVLRCIVDSNPAPHAILWIPSGGNATEITEGPDLVITDLGEFEYVCSAYNEINGVTYNTTHPYTFTVVERAGDGLSTGELVAIVLGSIVGLLLVIIVIYFVIIKPCIVSPRHGKSPKGRSITVEEATNQIHFSNSTYSSDYNTSSEKLVKSKKGLKLSQAYEADVDIFPGDIRINSKLGHGKFGVIWHAYLTTKNGKTEEVAVKTLRGDAGEREKSDLQHELEIMQSLPPHVNVIKFIGCCTETDPVQLVLEYLSVGDLKSVLVKHRGQDNKDATLKRTSNTLTQEDLLLWAQQIARGMSHLVENHLVHRDLAARNILLDENSECKICDFGLSRRTNKGQVEIRNEGVMPVRWMSPESMIDKIFTPSSDVWSFGVLLWELVTLGGTPYKGMKGIEVKARVQGGYRLPKPEHCDITMYDLMDECWNSEPDKRPSFTKLVHKIDFLLRETESNYVDLENFDEELYENVDIRTQETIDFE